MGTGEQVAGKDLDVQQNVTDEATRLGRLAEEPVHERSKTPEWPPEEKENGPTYNHTPSALQQETSAASEQSQGPKDAIVFLGRSADEMMLKMLKTSNHAPSEPN